MLRRSLPYWLRRSLEDVAEPLRFLPLAAEHYLVFGPRHPPVIYCKDGYPSRLQVAVWNG